RQNGALARPAIARKTDLSLSSITNIINYLLEKNLVHAVGRQSNAGAGRRAALISFNASARFLVCINIEPLAAHVALCDLSGTIISMSRIVIRESHTAGDVLAMLLDAVNTIVSEQRDVCAIGISVSGHVTPDSGVVSSSIMRWKDVRVRDYFEHATGLHVYVSNNSKTKALWQIAQYGGELPHRIIFLDLAQGVGIISIYDGQVNESVSGELGHTTVMKEGPVCFCGNRGCLELVCSVKFILQRCREKRLAVTSFADALALFSSGCADIRVIFEECAEYLGIGIANIISLFEPMLIIINDNELTSCEFIYQTALEEAQQRAYNLFSKPVQYEKVTINSDHALKGVAYYVADRLFALDGPDDVM
ncbi:MAG: ROK family protein, partial [Clostridia bacterium]